jgi:hypothetical protein
MTVILMRLTFEAWLHVSTHVTDESVDTAKK